MTPKKPYLTVWAVANTIIRKAAKNRAGNPINGGDPRTPPAIIRGPFVAEGVILMDPLILSRWMYHAVGWSFDPFRPARQLLPPYLVDGYLRSALRDPPTWRCRAHRAPSPNHHEIHIVGTDQRKNSSFQTTDTDQVLFIDVPTIGLNLIRAAQFARRAKPCTVLYFISDRELESRFSGLIRPLIGPLFRFLIKFPEGPSIVVEDQTPPDFSGRRPTCTQGNPTVLRMLSSKPMSWLRVGIRIQSQATDANRPHQLAARPFVGKNPGNRMCDRICLELRWRRYRRDMDDSRLGWQELAIRIPGLCVRMEHTYHLGMINSTRS